MPDPLLSETKTMHPKIKSAFIVFTAIAIWAGLLLQFYIGIEKYVLEGHSTSWAIVQIFSFYTIQTNLLIALALTTILCISDSQCGQFFMRASVLTAIAVYISIVGLVYNTVLSGLWKPEGLFKLSDLLLHKVSPIAYVVCWLLLIPKARLPRKELLIWAIFPLLYFLFSLIRGAYTGLYPYPFLNAAKIGYFRVLLNAAVVLVIFMLTGMLFISISRYLEKRQSLSDKSPA